MMQYDEGKASRAWKTPLIALLLTAVIWLIFTWPLPRYVREGIPYVASKPRAEPVVQWMMPGDHLQLLYHFWLLSDMLSGNTPWFYNLYEFNTGDDATRREPGSYYAPFSVFFSIGDWLDGKATGWNLSIFISLWFSVLFSFYLLRRYAHNELAAWSFSATVIGLPFYWISLLGGSPAGFALMWVPALLLGLDIAVREERWSGGLLAGIAVLGACWCDTHVFFFSVLVIPGWCVLAFLQRAGFSWTSPQRYRALALALSPVALLTLYALYSNQSSTSQLADSHAGGGRSLREVALFSPRIAGLFSWQEMGTSNHIFVGYVITTIILLGFTAFILRFKQHGRSGMRPLIIYLLLLSALVVIVVLALGPNGPWDGRALSAVRKIIPPYAMIRQPAKIFCLMPVLLAVSGVMALTALSGSRTSKRFCNCLAIVLALLVLTEYRMQVQAEICLLDRKQLAYQAVKQDAERQHETPRAMAIPLWPGDTHYSSLYEYYSSLYRIRMVNGYQPFVPLEYMTNVFGRFESVNQGALTDQQIHELTSRGINHLILHEDVFPEKVSPFPVTATLMNLLNHPNVQLLRQDGSVWAFKLLEVPRQKDERGADWKYIFPTRFYEAERNWKKEADVTVDPAASCGSFLQLSRTNAATYFTPCDIARTPGLRWMLRVRGKGAMSCDRFVGDDSVGSITMNVDADEWTWRDILAPEVDGYRPVAMSLTWMEGHVDIDMAIVAAGEWPRLAPGESMVIPAACFFHAGYIDVAADSVVFTKERYDRRNLFYGPKLPLEPGTYRLLVDYKTDAPLSTVVGDWHIDCPEDTILSRFEMKAGGEVVADFRIEKNLPFVAVYAYDAIHTVELSKVTITRMADAKP